MKVLNVDDQAENRLFMETLLRSQGHQVDSACNGREALELAQCNSYDLIVSDILMPRMDGFQFCREIKRDERTQSVPFIFFTATYTDSPDEQFALNLGADRFLVKPMEPDALLAEIDAVMRRKSASNAASPKPQGPVEEEFLVEYNSRLVAKLEKKLVELDEVNKALQADIRVREEAEAEKNRLEKRLRQAEKLEAIGTLAGGIAHDFNNILSGIVGYADLILYESPDLPQARHNADEIVRAAKRAQDLIRQILAFSRQQDQERRPIRIQRVIDDALRLMRASIPANVQFESTIDPGAPAVLADETQVHQIVTNLFTNAWHAMQGTPGRIKLRLDTVNPDSELRRAMPDLGPGLHIRLSVEDNGQGMDALTLQRIFEPFFSTKKAGMGTGLGLATVHGIVRSWEGAISVQSRPGHGTSFQIYVPAFVGEAEMAEERSASILRGRGERVLIVDDEEFLVDLGVRLLRYLGYSPVALSDPYAALEQVRETKFDLVIADFSMPTLSGLEMGQQMLRLQPGLKILLATGYLATLDEKKIRALGFCGVLEKPYTLPVLGAAMSAALKP